MHGIAHRVVSPGHAALAGARQRLASCRFGRACRALAGPQRGNVLLAVSILLLLAGAAAGLGGSKPAATQRSAATARVLAQAKAAVVARAVTVYATRGKHVAPGLLPFPDRNRDGRYDGEGDCVTFGLAAAHLLGRLPWAGDGPPCPRRALGLRARDASGEQLWYAVSRNLVAGGGGGPVNSGMAGAAGAAHAWLVVRGFDGAVLRDPRSGAPLPVAAVIIAPGAAIGRQQRRGMAPAAEHYLDRIRIGGVTYDNADADGCADAVRAPCDARESGEEFIVHPGGAGARAFNDRVVYITVMELMRAVEKRVLGEVAVALNRYRTEQGVYPWLVSLGDPRATDFKSDLSRRGLLPVHLPDEVFTTRFGASWNLEDATPTSVTRHSGDAALVPTLEDVLRGLVRVTRVSGRCLWSEPSRAQCTGVDIDSDYFRADLGVPVKRTVEISFSLEDDAFEVTPPTPGDVRRRTLSMRGAGLARTPASPGAAPWNVRVTDENAFDWGRRELRIDSDTAGALTLSGVRFDLSVVYDDLHDARDELPEWFAENDWHHYIYVALSADAAPGGDSDGDGDCQTPVDTCLRLRIAGEVARSDIRALAVSAGAALAGQNRARGECGGEGRSNGFRCAFMEGDNGDDSTPRSADTFVRDGPGARFNDQIRVIAPLPP